MHRAKPFRHLLFASSLALSLGSTAMAGTTGSDQLARDTTDVPHVMDAFHDAVVAHDTARIASLFIAEGSAWNTVLTDRAFAAMQNKKPGLQKIRTGSYKDFLKFVATTQQTLEPQRSHVHIQQDGALASAYFDYSFIIDGKVENTGHETWQLVKGTNGWRIAAIAYSSDPPTP